jgi:hypothetical protein
MYKMVDIDELYKQKEEIYKLCKTDKKKYHNELDKICKKIRYHTDTEFRKEKNRIDNIRITLARSNLKKNRDLNQNGICAI